MKPTSILAQVLLRHQDGLATVFPTAHLVQAPRAEVTRSALAWSGARWCPILLTGLTKVGNENDPSLCGISLQRPSNRKVDVVL